MADSSVTSADPSRGSVVEASTGPKSRPRQAIVVLHGMGQQSAMSTLRSFIKVAAPQPQDPSEPWFYSRPDKAADSGRFDQRRYLVRPKGQRVQTELYEYHWAHLMSGNQLSHMKPLVKSALLRWPNNPRIGLLWVLAWTLVLGAAALGIYLVLSTGRTLESADLDSVVALIGAAGVWGWVLTQLLNRISGFAVGTLADFARYNDPSPGNQKVRDDIRRGLIELLEDLHNSTITRFDRASQSEVTFPRYDRIIVATHSLGSVVAYDAISFLWARMNKLHAKPDAARPFASTKLVELEALAGDLNVGNASVEQFQAAQRDAWMEQRANGNPWRITDLVTFGNPMAQAHQLMAKSPSALREQICRLEAPSCPPQPDRHNMTGPKLSETEADWAWCKKTAEEQKAAHDAGEWHYFWTCSAGAPIASHAAPFALIRWTNIWYNADLFGGPLVELFGYGVKDVMAVGDGFLSKIPLVAHTQYLRYTKKPSAGGATNSLRDALDLEALSWLKAVPRLDVDKSSAKHTTLGTVS